jgi:hypothetical protein
MSGEPRLFDDGGADSLSASGDQKTFRFHRSLRSFHCYQSF